MSTWKTTGSLTSRSFSVIRSNFYLLLYPLLTGVFGILIFAIFGAIAFGVIGGTDGLEQAANAENPATEVSPLVYVVMAIGAYVVVALTQFMMGALVYCAHEELNGRDASFGQGIGAAMSRLPALLGWALIQALVGWLLSLIRGDGQNSNPVVAIVRVIAASLLSVAWTLITFFVLPFIMVEKKGTIDAIKSSFALLRQTWGKQLVGNVRIALIMLILIIPASIAIIGGIVISIAANPAIGLPLLFLGGVVLIAAQVIYSAIRNIFAVALFHYAKAGEGIGPFNTEELAGAIKTR